MDLGVTIIGRECSGGTGPCKLLRGLGLKPKEAKTLIETFGGRPGATLQQYEDYTDEEDARQCADRRRELKLFARDIGRWRMGRLTTRHQMVEDQPVEFFWMGEGSYGPPFSFSTFGSVFPELNTRGGG